MKNVLKRLWLVVALPISLVIVFFVFLRGGPIQGAGVRDPVHRPASGSQPSSATKPTPPSTRPLPPICDPVHLPPTKAPEK